jgi:hypothetical protein
MAEKYFEKFPVITYANNYVRNITERTTILNSVYNSPLAYYQYSVKQGERPDTIADRYYKDEYMGWILHLTNKVIDPYYDWYMDETTFKDFIVKKYGSYVNTVSKVVYYRNNWYSYTDPISQAEYDAIDTSLKRFYEPIYSDVYYSTTPLGYKRKQIDWKKSTNKIVSYNVNGSSFTTNEIADVYIDSNKLGSGQVCGKTANTLTIQHTTGSVTDDVGIGTFTVRGRESKANAVYTDATLVLDNIPTVELNYWDPVYCYDYENEINERNKSIKVLKSTYSGQISKELKSLLR